MKFDITVIIHGSIAFVEFGYGYSREIPVRVFMVVLGAPMVAPHANVSWFVPLLWILLNCAPKVELLPISRNEVHTPPKFSAEAYMAWLGYHPDAFWN